MTTKQSNKFAKVAKIIVQVLMYAFFALCLVALIFTIVSKKDSDGTATIFGMQMRTVLTDSMAKCDQTYDQISQYAVKDIYKGNVVFISVAPENPDDLHNWYKSLQAGDVLTFKYDYSYTGRGQIVITHRISDIVEKGNGFVITLKGDNKSSTEPLEQTIDTTLVGSPNYVIGKVVGKSVVLGGVITAFKHPVGIVCIVIIPCLIIMAMEIIKLVNVLGGEKRKKLAQQQQDQQAEIDQLKRQLAAMQQQVDIHQTQPPSQGDESVDQ